MKKRRAGIINGVLPASQTTNRPYQYWIENRALVLGAIALALYALIVGWGWRGGWLDAGRAYGWMALPCLVLVAWYAYGFLKVADKRQDFGLLLSAAGWALIALALLIKDSALRAATAAQNGIAPGLANEPDAPLATMCLVLGLIWIIGGAVVAWDAWRKENL